MRIVTYNIRGGLGTDNIRSIERIAEVLQEIQADIVCLQEVHKRLPWSRLVDQPGWLRSALRYGCVFQANYRVGFGQFGNCILTRFPIVSNQSIRLPNECERRSVLRYPERRGLQKAVVVTEIGQLTILNTHWSLHSRDRIESSGVVADAAKEAKSPILLAGDFNAEDGSEEIIRLGNDAGLVDLGFENRLLTFTADQPKVRIDYVWGSEKIQAFSLRVWKTQASDHFPVVVDFEIALD